MYNFNKVERIDFLDGLRGISILAVVLFHSYHIWNFRETFEQNTVLSMLFSQGSLGVELFFMISGFVIFMTLERTRTLKLFIWKRWLRLMPLIIITSLLIYLTAPLLTYRPEGPLSVGSLLPSLTLIPPGILSNTLGIGYYPFVDGVLWSLIAEVFFYFMASFFFYVLKDKRLIGLTFFYVSYFILIQVFLVVPIDNIQNNFVLSSLVNIILFLDNYYVFKFGWFLIGVYLYMYFKETNIDENSVVTIFDKPKTQLYLMLFMLIILMATNRVLEPERIMWYPLALLIFTAPFFSEKIRIFFNIKFLTYLGLISYPLYLFHTNFIVGLSSQLHIWIPIIPVELLPLGPFAAACLLAGYLERIDKEVKPKLIKIAQKLNIIN